MTVGPRQSLRIDRHTIRIRILLFLGVTILACGNGLAEAGDTQVRGELQLRNGDHLPGTFADGSQEDAIRWLSPVAENPFDFMPRAIGAVYFPAPQTATPIAAPFSVELAGGDMLFGSLTAIIDDKVHLETPDFGLLTLSTRHIARILPWGDSSGIRYVGPNGLGGWKTAGHKLAEGAPQDSDGAKLIELGWREAAGHLVVEQPSPAITTQCAIPATCQVELSVGWQGKPDFGVTLFVEGPSGTPALPITLQVIDRPGKPSQLIAIAEGSELADLVPLTKLDPKAGTFHVILYVDRVSGSAEIRTVDGEPLGRLDLPSVEHLEPDPEQQSRKRLAQRGRGGAPPAATPRIEPGIVLSNRGHTFRFERLLVRGWSGQLPSHASPDQGLLVAGEKQLTWQSLTFDEGAGELVTSNNDQEVRTSIDELTFLSFPTTEISESPSYRVTLHDGTRLSGTVHRCAEGKLVFRSPAVEQEFAVAVSRLSSLVSMREGDTEAPELTGRKGTLEASGLRSQGALVASTPQQGTTPLAWQPWGSLSAQPLLPEIAGRIVYRRSAPRTSPPEREPQQQARVRAQPQPRGLLQMIFNSGTPPSPQEETAPTPRGQAVLYLRSGDRFPGKLVRITESTAHFESPMTEATSVPLDQMTMWERDHHSELDELDPEKRRRLLTIPRMQRNNPPTHLLETFSGDFLRARLVRVEGDKATVEVRLEEKEIALATIRRILWLAGTSEGAMEDDIQPASRDEPVTDRLDHQPLVLAVGRDNTRLAFTPLAMENETLSGVSPHLGECQVKLADIDILYLGSEVARQAQAEAVAKWKVVPAKDPKFVNEEEPDSPSRAGLDAPLVGEAAPDFVLKTLDNQEFRLSDRKGQVVVLDFFATWCGPCIQAMPEVDQIVSEYEDQGVELVAVNMQEDKKSVERLLERLKLEPTVVLDVDGATAEKYGVTAIPQTVIVDREGRVARLYVGGGPAFATQLREAIKSLADAPQGDPTAETSEPAGS